VKTRLAVLLVLCFAMSSVLGGFAMAGTAARTKVTIKGPNGDFQGKLKSADEGCLGDRLVRLFSSAGPDGPFERTGNSDTSEQQGTVGVWSMGNTGLRDGYFFAKVKKTPECRGGKSKVIYLVDGVPQ
jgi:hypothetical protein